MEIENGDVCEADRCQWPDHESKVLSKHCHPLFIVDPGPKIRKTEIKLVELVYKSCIRRKELALANGAFLNGGGDFAIFFVRFSASPRGAPRDYDRAPRERRVSPTTATLNETSESNSLTSFQTNVQYSTDSGH